MTYCSRILPTESFPQDLRELDDRAVHVLHSKVLRELDAEYLRGASELETEFRRDELTEELNRRELNEHPHGMSGSPSRLQHAI